MVAALTLTFPPSVVSMSMLLRESCAWVTSISVLMTCWTRKARSDMVIFSFTR